MTNEIVKFSNQFNAQPLRRFDAIHLDLLLAVASKVRDKGTDEVTFTFQELRDLADIKNKMSNEQFAYTIAEVNARLLALNFRYEDERQIVQFALFHRFVTDKVSETLTVSVDEDFKFLLNDLTSKFTRFELHEFTDLRSSYAKEFYRRAKQYRSTGTWSVSLEEFRNLLDIPKSYSLSDIDKRVLNPICLELEPLINLQFKKSYAKPRGRGRSRLVGYVFSFNTEHYSPSKNGKKVSVVTPKPERYSPSEYANTFDVEEYKKSHDGLTPREVAKRESNKTESHS